MQMLRLRNFSDCQVVDKQPRVHGSKRNLVEMGAQTNTVEEIRNACDPLAQTLDMVLSGMVY